MSSLEVTRCGDEFGKVARLEALVEGCDLSSLDCWCCWGANLLWSNAISPFKVLRQLCKFDRFLPAVEVGDMALEEIRPPAGLALVATRSPKVNQRSLHTKHWFSTISSSASSVHLEERSCSMANFSTLSVSASFNLDAFLSPDMDSNFLMLSHRSRRNASHLVLRSVASLSWPSRLTSDKVCVLLSSDCVWWRVKVRSLSRSRSSH